MLDLAQLSLSCLKNQENLGYVHTVRSIQEAGEAGEIENRRCAVVHTNFLDKKKATNFSASILRIGLWKVNVVYFLELRNVRVFSVNLTSSSNFAVLEPFMKFHVYFMFMKNHGFSHSIIWNIVCATVLFVRFVGSQKTS